MPAATEKGGGGDEVSEQTKTNGTPFKRTQEKGGAGRLRWQNAEPPVDTGFQCSILEGNSGGLSMSTALLNGLKSLSLR